MAGYAPGRPLQPEAGLIIQKLLGAEDGQILASDLLAVGAMAEDLLAMLAKKACAISLAGPGVWRGQRGGRGHFALDMDRAIVTVTDEAALRTILRMGRRDRPAEPPKPPKLALVREDGAA